MVSAPCSSGLLLPILDDAHWNRTVKVLLYLSGLVYVLVGNAIISDVFTQAIECITSKTRISPDGRKVKVWNDTVAGLSLMTLGSSASEIALSVIEIVGNKFESGDLGPGSIVGSAAFNILVITAACVIAVPGNRIIKIEYFAVYTLVSLTSILGYLWLLVILVVHTPSQVEIWEALVTLLFFPILLLVSYYADKSDQMRLGLHEGYIDEAEECLSVEAIKEVTKKLEHYSELTEDDIATIAAIRSLERRKNKRTYYRIRAIRKMTGSQLPTPTLSAHLQMAMMVLDKGLEVGRTIDDVAIVEFTSSVITVEHSTRRAVVNVVRYCKLENMVTCRVRTIHGTAIEVDDFVPVDSVLRFDPGEVLKMVSVEVLPDSIREGDEKTFFLQLTLDKIQDNVQLGVLTYAEIHMQDAQGIPKIQFKKSAITVITSERRLVIPVVRSGTSDLFVQTHWRTGDLTALDEVDYRGGEGVITFQRGENEKHLEIYIVDDLNPEKMVQFEVELRHSSEGSVIGRRNLLTVTIVGDIGVNERMERIAERSREFLKEWNGENQSWGDWLRHSLSVTQNASRFDYFAHCCTWGWKLLFCLVPPNKYLGGWLRFVVSLLMTCVISTLVGDLASILGCLVGMRDGVTSLTLVAVGTCLPDVLASRLAAQSDSSADYALATPTGNNVSNVFLGLGLTWLIGATYWELSTAGKLQIETKNLTFVVVLYCSCATFAFLLLLFRRLCPVCGGGELGGPKVMAWISCVFLLVLYVSFLTLCILEENEIIPGFL